MIKIFDGHADIWYDVAYRRKNGEENIVEKYHLERLQKGGVMGGIFVAFLDEGLENELAEMIHMVNSTINEIKNNENIFNIIKKNGDFEKGLFGNKLNVLMGIEGLKVIKSNLDWLDTFYELGFRHASLTWNEENSLGTGAKGDFSKGLTNIGVETIKKMEKLGMLVDVSHANEKTFWDILNIAKKPLIASHSNAKKLCNHIRNLDDDQIRAIGKNNGVIGIVAYKHFVDSDEKYQTVERYVDHIDYIVSLIGIDHVGLGFDFCEYLDRNQCGRSINPLGLEDASCSQKIIEVLEKRGYSNSDILKIAYLNFQRVINSIL